MRNILVLAGAVLMLWACSSPRYTYNFDYYDYNSGRTHRTKAQQKQFTDDANPLVLEERMLVASAAPVILTKEDLSVEDVKTSKASATSNSRVVKAKNTASTLAEKKISTAEKEHAALAAKKYRELSKTQRKEFRQEFRRQFKQYVVAKRSRDHIAAANATGGLDYDLKMAIIFGAVGLTLSLFGGINEAFWVLGVISIVVGVVFLVKWLVRQ
ncbi:MAG TPA: hypothetical protein VIN08_20030 [Ohtaekwangia sp.]|uniref:hypothetical protein n=1 Tax=Ohtaekwangia sp. TaxID=2066019 RepID=UPI002F94A8C5